MNLLPVSAPIFLLLVGRNMLNSTTQKIINQGHFKDRIIFTGFRKDVLEIVKGSDAFILPSTGKEGLPKVVIEAMCVGTPVIATDITANKGLVFDRKNALLIQPHDPLAISKAILEYYNNADLRDQMSKNALSFMENEFTLGQTVDDLRQLYESLIQ